MPEQWYLWILEHMPLELQHAFEESRRHDIEWRDQHIKKLTADLNYWKAEAVELRQILDGETK